MATKEVAIKIKIDGKEVDATNTRVELFKRNIEKLKNDLDALGERTSENAEQFDKLKGSIDQLESAFVDTNKEIQDTNQSLDENDEQVQTNTQTTKSYAAQIRTLTKQLSALGDRTDANGKEYDALAEKIRNLREKQEDLQFGTKKLDDALASLPGPIGTIAGKFKSFDDGLKNAKSGLKALTAQFPILKNAIVATGIGALVILFGLLVGAVIKAFNSFKPLQDAVKNFGLLFDILGKTIQPLIDLIGKGLTAALNFLAKALAFVTGNLDEFNKAVADKKSTEDAIKNSKDRQKAIEEELITAKGVAKEKLEAEKKYQEEKEKLLADEVLTKAEKDKELLLLEKKYSQELLTIDEKTKAERISNEKNFQKERLDQAKTIRDKFFEIEQARLENENLTNKERLDKQKEFDLKKLEENTKTNKSILLADKELSKLKIEQDQNLTEQEKTIRLNANAKYFNDLIKQNDDYYKVYAQKIETDYAKQIIDANKELNEQLKQLQISNIQDENLRAEKTAQDTRDKKLQAIKDSIVTDPDLIKQYVDEVWTEYNNAIDKIEKTSTDKQKENLLNSIKFDQTTRKIGLDNRLRDLAENFDKEKDIIEEQRKIRIEQVKLDAEIEKADLDAMLANKQISATQYADRLKAISQETTSFIREINQSAFQENLNLFDKYAMALNGVADSIGSIVDAMDKNSKAAKALSKVQEALAATTLTLAAAKALLGITEQAKLPFPANVVAIASTVASVAAAVAAWAKLFKKSAPSTTDSTSSSTSTETPNYGKNYADGGFIYGNSHSQGGVKLVAEGGEAIMTKSAVSMFAPMLSMMNQMGGGKSISPSLSYYDKPKETNDTPLVIKTYVVSTDLVRETEKQARLKSLSTL